MGQYKNIPKKAKTISVAPGISILVDEEDYDFLIRFNWRIGAPFSNFEGRASTINRIIMKPKKDVIVDHINGDPFDNRKCNLRFCTKAQNAMNSNPRKTGTSKYKGVSKCVITNKWRARLHLDDKDYWLGRFKTEEEAAIAYNKKATELFGEFALLNRIENA